MSKSYVEIDFFQREKWNNAPSKPSSPESASSPFRAPAGIQSVVSRINPQLLKMVMAAEHARSQDNIAAWPTSSSPPFPFRTASSPALPLYNPASRCSISPSTGTAPLTIFYNGTVTIFDVYHDMICQSPGGNRYRGSWRTAERGSRRHPPTSTTTRTSSPPVPAKTFAVDRLGDIDQND